MPSRARTVLPQRKLQMFAEALTDDLDEHLNLLNGERDINQLTRRARLVSIPQSLAFLEVLDLNNIPLKIFFKDGIELSYGNTDIIQISEREITP
ncbi:MAG: hypothetical protein KIH08_15870, partial [Candidatus Freyarchaeota archaeon]|nr:hypothetical protein [Candidatus Jordarchaeia archaeon]